MKKIIVQPSILILICMLVSCSALPFANPPLTSTPCLLPICAENEILYCPGECPDVCSLICVMPAQNNPETETPTPTAPATPTITPSYQVELLAVGDIMLGRTIGDLIISEGPHTVFAGVQTILDTADLLLGNLECAITETSNEENKSYTFAAPLEAAQALSVAGFDLVSLANNHAMDFGPEGLTDTWDALFGAGVAHTGTGLNSLQAHSPRILIHNGLRIAFFGYVDVPIESRSKFDTRLWEASDNQPGLAWADPDQIGTDVAGAVSQADIIIVLLHSGFENYPGINSIQRTAAYAAIDAGATAVIGSHPHILQQMEWYKGKLIAYSLGNFVFDDFYGDVNLSTILRITLDRQGILRHEWIPVSIDDRGLPHPANDEEADLIYTMINP